MSLTFLHPFFFFANNVYQILKYVAAYPLHYRSTFAVQLPNRGDPSHSLLIGPKPQYLKTPQSLQSL